jgi:hypothetical protein
MTFSKEQQEELKGRLLSFVSRKFILSVIIMAVSSAMVIGGSLDADIWLKVVAADVLGYNFGNAFSKRAK